MYTECSSCHTYFKITPAQLKAADGKVRCGNCGEVFNALDNLTDVVPPSSAKSQPSKAEESARLSDSLSATEGVADEFVSSPLDENAQTADELGSLQMEEQPELDRAQADSLEMDLPGFDESDNQEEINKDIDDALNELLNDDDLQSRQQDSVKENSMLSAVSVFGGSELESQASAKGDSGLRMKDEYSSLDIDDQLATLNSDVDLSKPGSRLDSDSGLEPTSVDFDLSDSELGDDTLHSRAERKLADSTEKQSEKDKKAADDYVLEELKERPSEAASRLTGSRTNNSSAKITRRITIKFNAVPHSLFDNLPKSRKI